MTPLSEWLNFKPQSSGQILPPLSPSKLEVDPLPTASLSGSYEEESLRRLNTALGLALLIRESKKDKLSKPTGQFTMSKSYGSSIRLSGTAISNYTAASLNSSIER